MSDKIRKSEEEWREQLTDEQYRITRKAGTEPAFTGEYWNNKEHGEYFCIGCGITLFSSERKYDSGSGWPSFTKPSDGEAIEERVDESHGMVRTEVVCSKCDAHLGHKFPDGPSEDGGMRYCINSAALSFEKKDE